MRSVNKVILVGRLTDDPVLRTTGTGTSVCNFGLATNRQYVDKQNQRKEIPEYHNIVAWSNLAEICSEYLRKGDQVYVEGRIQAREYAAKDGSTKTSIDIIINEMMMLSSKNKGEDNTFKGDAEDALL